MFQRLLLFEKAGSNLQGIGSLLVINEKNALVVSARELIPAMGKTLWVSTDGTRNNLRQIEDWKEVPTPGIRIEPFAYIIRFKRNSSD